MDKISHHIHKHKEKIIAHISKHHKKYIFAIGATIGAGVFKIAAIIAIFMGISMTAERSNANNAEVEMYKAMNIFYQISEIAHEEAEELEEAGGPFTQESKEKFEEIEEAFHKAKNLNERYRTAKQIVDFLLEQEKTRPHIEDDRDSERDKKFRELLQIFNRMN